MGRGRTVLSLSAVFVGLVCVSSSAVEITRFDFDANSVGGRNLSFSQSPSQAIFSIVGDGFGIYQVDVTDPLPDQFLDESTDGQPSDDLGIINSHPVNGKLDRWFGAVDIFNPNNMPGTGTAEWQFDISGVADPMTVSIDMAAMGDFTPTDFGHPVSFQWSWSIDGGPATEIFSSSVDENGSVTYTMADGDMFTYDDPLLMNGTVLNNVFQTITADAPGFGAVATLTLNAEGDGHEKVHVFDDIVIDAIPEPASLALLALGGLLCVRRRRA